MKTIIIKYLLVVVCFFFVTDAKADNVFLQEQSVMDFIDMMVKKHGFTAKEMVDIFTEAKYIDNSPKSADKPAEILDWATYSARMVNPLRVKQGREYYRKNKVMLATAESIYGVPDFIIAGILGIETNYGSFKLRYRAVDALSSLAFFFPRRSEYFKKELETLLVYSKRLGVDPFSYLSSYAGAVGIPQFMPSNIIAYAVDADFTGKADIINNHKDAIYSIGNFLKNHNWKKGKPVLTEVRLKGNGYARYVKTNPCAKDAMNNTVQTLKNAGILFPMQAGSGDKVSLFSLQTAKGAKHFVAFENFCSLFKYNPSLHYAMAVSVLAASITSNTNKMTVVNNK